LSDIDVLSHFDEYYEMAAEAERLLAQTDYEKMESNHLPKEFCHGNYNYHNIIFNGDKVAVINFEKAGAGLQIKDFYFFLRKVLEKHNWNLELGYNIIDKRTNI
jgi:thiamine kinase-like enzyme